MTALTDTTATAGSAAPSPEAHTLSLRGRRCGHWLWPALPGHEHEPTLVLLHGWMDASVSFFPLAQALRAQGLGAAIRALDWRGFGHSWHPDDVQEDGHAFMDYLADLDGWLSQLSLPPVLLLGHSLGGNVAFAYAALRPQRLAGVVNIEGFGLPDSDPAETPDRLVQWLDGLATPAIPAWMASREAALSRWCRWHPRVPRERLQALLTHFIIEDLRGVLLRADPVHKRRSPVPYRWPEHQAMWRKISVPALWLQGQDTDVAALWQGRLDQATVDMRLAQVPGLSCRLVPGAAHMVHLEQPEATAQALGPWLASQRCCLIPRR